MGEYAGKLRAAQWRYRTHTSTKAEGKRRREKRRRLRKADERHSRLKAADPTGWSKHNDHHWFKMVNGVKLNYWPTTGKYQLGNGPVVMEPPS